VFECLLFVLPNCENFQIWTKIIYYIYSGGGTLRVLACSTETWDDGRSDWIHWTTWIFRSLCDLMTVPNISNGANLRLPLDTQNTKGFRGALSSWPPTGGSAAWTPAGGFTHHGIRTMYSSKLTLRSPRGMIVTYSFSLQVAIDVVLKHLRNSFFY